MEAASSQVHMPAQRTTQSASMSPCSVATPTARPPEVRMEVTGTRSTIRAPAARAPAASARVMSAGFA